MKIISRGEIPEKKPVRMTCDHCKTLAEFEQSEMRPVFDQRDGDYWSVSCPVCEREITKAIRA